MSTEATGHRRRTSEERSVNVVALPEAVTLSEHGRGRITSGSFSGLSPQYSRDLEASPTNQDHTMRYESRRPGNATAQILRSFEQLGTLSTLNRSID